MSLDTSKFIYVMMDLRKVGGRQHEILAFRGTGP